MQKICGIYKITNTITGDFYVGSSEDVTRRWNEHKLPSTWNKCPNNPLYQDFKKYGADKFAFEILAEVEADSLKEKEQQFIETLKPAYNDRNANGLNVERRKESKKKYKKEYQNQLCFYNGQTLTLNALSQRFWRQGISNPSAEAKKYLLY